MKPFYEDRALCSKCGPNPAVCDKISLGYRKAGEIINDLHRQKRHGQKIPKRKYYCEEHKQWHLACKGKDPERRTA